jgi:hypothetical protein
MNDELASLFERFAGRRQSQQFLQRMGLDPRQFVLFLGLFRTLSEREELSGPIGANRFNLSYLALYAGAIGVLPWSLMACSSMPAPIFLVFDLVLVFILTFLIMIRESANVFFNPAGFSVFAHAPIHTATYAAAQIIHILITVFYLIFGLALYPAFIGTILHGARWYWFFTHLTAAILIGLWTTIFICALYGVVSRFMPSHLLKSISQWMQSVICIAMIAVPLCFPEIFRQLLAVRYGHSAWNWLPLLWFAEIGMQGCHGASWQAGWQGFAAIAASVPILWLGLRNLSGNYLFKTSSTIQTIRPLHLQNAAAIRIRNTLIRFITGSPLGLAAYCFVGKMMRRDWQYRRTIMMQSWLLLIIIVAMILSLFHDAHPASPFSANESFMHLLPHLMGLIAMVLCANLCYSDFYKGSWIYMASPMKDLKAYTKGVFVVLWIPTAGLSHIILLPFLVWFWGWKEGLLVTGFSLIVVSLYLVFEITLIAGLPFANPTEEFKAVSNTTRYQFCGLMSLMIPSSLQWSIFQIRWLTLTIGTSLIILTIIIVRWSLGEFESEISWNLHRIKSRTSLFYREM